MNNNKLTLLPEWQALIEHQQSIADLHMRDLFQDDKQRFNKFSLVEAGLLLDYSKNRITDKTINLLCQLAEKQNVHQKISALFQGDKLNTTELRPALHTALRDRKQQTLIVDGRNIMPSITDNLKKMAAICDDIFQGKWPASNHKKITDIVNIGIGGSDLGPRLVTHALAAYAKKDLRLHFLSSIDGAQICPLFDQLIPEQTLFIISSKSFTTAETLDIAGAARAWLEQHSISQNTIARHFVAVTNAPKKAQQFGVAAENILFMEDWIGGRYSIWSAIGLPIALSIGIDSFLQMLDGAYAMDQHFQTAPFNRNMPVILGLLGIWYSNFFAAQSHAILPYSFLLRDFPSYLQQLTMESNGKQTDLDNNFISYASSPIIFGEIGTLGQHAFHQLLHQGTHLVPVDFIVPINSDYPLYSSQTSLFANALAQSKALMEGKFTAEIIDELRMQGLTEERIKQLAPHKTLVGNQPSNTLVMQTISPFTLGALIALYEHKVFVQSAIWNINAFDQWGVETGKQLAEKILPDLVEPEKEFQHDSSTNGLIKFFRKHVRADA